MSHEITSSDGAVFHKVPAWHGLGHTVEQAMSPDDAMNIAGLGWTVSISDGISAGDVSSTDYRAIIRDDTRDILSVQSPGYRVVQNHEVFNLAYALDGEVKVESALSMGGGRKVVVLLKGDTFAPSNSPGDAVTPYLALMSSHDGSLALSALPTSVRIVCRNTLNMALASGSRGMYRVTHNGDMEEKKRGMEAALRKYRDTGALFREKVDALSRREMNAADIQTFWLRVYERLAGPVPVNPATEAEEAARDKAADEMARWSATFDEERRKVGGPASLWVAANAVTASIQHRVGKRGRPMSFDSRAFSNLAGDKQEDTLLVMREALALA
jgi:phage/plasmid-like protein (TIGR03299 family)